MSALTLTGAPKVAVRQHRLTLRLFTAAVLLTGALTVALAVLASTSDEDRGAARIGRGSLDYLLLAAQTPMALLPLLVGAFVAGPLVARELENGTYTWLWTQSVSPARWLATNVTIAALVAATGSAVLAAVFRLGAENAGSPRFRPLTEGIYGMIGPVTVGYSLLGVGLGVLLGMLIRRTVPAMVAAAVAVTVVNQIFVRSLRDELWPVVTIDLKDDLAGSTSHHVVEDGVMTATGGKVPLDACFSDGRSIEGCAKTHQGVSFYADVHPESHFWPLQLIETGILIAVAALAVAVAFRVLDKRHGGSA
jgi:hypothetical protein